MNIQDFRAGLDLLFEQNRISEVEPFLEGALRVAIEEQDDNAVVHILNEMIGFYRETCDYDRSIMYGEKALEIIAGAGEKDSHAYATTELNLANALRAAGRIADSLERYADTERIYGQILTDEAFDFANLYNNMSLAYQEAQMYPEAIDCLNKAMEIVLLYPDKRFELAVTHANLGNSLLGAVRLDPAISKRHEDIYDGIRVHLTEAVNIFTERNENGAHLGSALMGLGDLYTLLGDDAEAVKYYAQALEAVDRNLGHIEYYYRVRDNYEAACARLREGKPQPGTGPDADMAQKARSGAGTDTAALPDMILTGAELSRLWYEEIVAPMIAEKYPELKDHICAGLFGEGSDAYGYDDMESRDHDWGPGVILLINNRGDFDRFGQRLAADLLEKADKTGTFHGFKIDTDSIRKGRRGVFYTEDYFSSLLGKRLTEYLMETVSEARAGSTETHADTTARSDRYDIYLSAPEYAMAAAVNGRIWSDPDGTVTEIRRKLNGYYPEAILRSMLMQNAALYSQNAQYNYLRMKRRGDNASADMLLAEGMKNAARIACILEKRYAPHDKWLFRCLDDLTPDETAEMTGAPESADGSEPYSGHGVRSRIDSIFEYARRAPVTAPTDAAMRPVMEAMDDLSLYLQERMIELGLITRPARYMEDCLMELDPNRREELVKRVVKDEWEAFDKVINEGGRADCQDNWNTFNIMRSSQYLTWDIDMLIRYAEDFEASVAAGWNPIMEKYGRMEESTAPDRYAAIADKLPPVPDEKRAIIEEIVAIQVGWMEEFAAEYPGMAGNARTIHTADDTPYDTSYETYLRGELMTYSDEMLRMYGAFIVRLAQNGSNLAHLTMENTALLYGYKSLDDAEQSL